MTSGQTPAQAALVAELRRLARVLEAHEAGEDVGAFSRPEPAAESTAPIDHLRRVFNLSAFEADVLLLCAGTELDADCAARIHRLQQGAAPHFALALAALPDAHWSALLPDGPLRHWRLVEMDTGPSLIGGGLRLDERILHFLVGLDYRDPRINLFAEMVPAPTELAPSHHAIAGRIDGCWRMAERNEQPLPAIQLCGDDPALNREIAAFACAGLGCGLLAVALRDLPEAAEERDRLMRLAEREALLTSACVLLCCDGAEAGGPMALRLIDRATAPMLVSAPAPQGSGRRAMLSLTVARVSPAEQRDMWGQLLGPEVLTATEIDTIAYQFHLKLGDMRAAVLEAANAAPLPMAQALWQACRHRARAAMTALVERIEPRASWANLILPERERAALQALTAQLRQRARVYGEWGFSDGGGRGLGVAAMFAGASGTGKTLAAEVLAGELGLDVYRIDLSAVVNKYIGETEKNLARVFDAAEAGGAILLFDEADALFGKRSEVKDSHDRHANIEVSYLLQRVEAYRGMAILTTNLKDSIDPAFLRRLRFIVNFPFPDAPQREAIWRAMFPPEMPLDGIDFAGLGRLNIAGGNIRNIALNAAFLAAGDGGALTMPHLATAARAEYAKLGRSLSEGEMTGWA